MSEAAMFEQAPHQRSELYAVPEVRVNEGLPSLFGAIPSQIKLFAVLKEFESKQGRMKLLEQPSGPDLLMELFEQLGYISPYMPAPKDLSKEHPKVKQYREEVQEQRNKVRETTLRNDAKVKEAFGLDGKSDSINVEELEVFYNETDSFVEKSELLHLVAGLESYEADPERQRHNQSLMDAERIVRMLLINEEIGHE